MKPLVGIDASRYPGELRTGTETYSRELIDAMATLGELPFEVRCYVNKIDDKNEAALGQLGEVARLPFPRFWTHFRLSGEMLRRRPDLLFVPSHVVPLVHPRSVVTVHDLGYLHEPKAHPHGQRLILDVTTRWNARVAKQVIAISETTRRDLIDHYGVPDSHITVVPHGVSCRFTRASSAERDRIRATYSLPDQFVLAVGRIQPRKNLARLAAAVNRLREKNPGLCLVIAGTRGWMSGQVLSEIQQILPADAWRELGYVPLDDLPGLYSCASVAAMVSTWEGFGLPVLEAMRCGVPTVISNAPALIEVAGDAALVAEATSVGEIAARIAQILDDPDLGEQLARPGHERALEFTWERTARETVSVLQASLL